MAERGQPFPRRIKSRAWKTRQRWPQPSAPWCDHLDVRDRLNAGDHLDVEDQLGCG